MSSHVGEESTNHLIPEFKDDFIRWHHGYAFEGDNCRFNNLDADLRTVCFQEEVEVLQSQLLLLGGFG